MFSYINVPSGGSLGLMREWMPRSDDQAEEEVVSSQQRWWGSERAWPIPCLLVLAVSCCLAKDVLFQHLRKHSHQSYTNSKCRYVASSRCQYSPAIFPKPSQNRALKLKRIYFLGMKDHADFKTKMSWMFPTESSLFCIRSRRRFSQSPGEVYLLN